MIYHKDVEHWLGSSRTLVEAIDVIKLVANGEYTPIELHQDILHSKSD